MQPYRRRILLTVAILLAAAGPGWMFLSRTKPDPTLRGTHELGTVLADSATVFRHEFEFRVPTDGAFKFGRLFTPKPCCTKLKLSPPTPGPGEAAVLTLECKMKDGPGEHTWQGAVFAQDALKPIFEATLTANVVARLRILPTGGLQLGTGSLGEPLHGALRVEQTGPLGELRGPPDRVLASDGLTVRFESPVEAASPHNSLWTLRTTTGSIDADASKEGRRSGNVSLLWNAAPSRPELQETVRVEWEVKPALIVNPKILRLAGEAKRSQELTVEDSRGRKFGRVDLAALDPWFECELSGLGTSKATIKLAEKATSGSSSMRQVALTTDLGKVEVFVAPKAK